MISVLSVVPVTVLQHECGVGVAEGPVGVGVRDGDGVGDVPSGSDAVESGVGVRVGVAVFTAGVGVAWQVSQKLTASDTASILSRGTCAASLPLASATMMAPVFRIEPPSELMTTRSRELIMFATCKSQMTSPSASMKR